MKHLELRIPFIYEAEVIMPRCRKSVIKLVRDETTVKIQQVSADAFPVALKVGGSEYHFNNDTFWCVNQVDSRSGREDITVDHVLNLDNSIKKNNYSPFSEFWKKCEPLNYGLTMLYIAGGDEAELKKDVGHREWLRDNKQEMLNIAESMANDILVFNNKFFHPAAEPMYKVVTFGMGGNHGGTGLFVETPCKEVAATDQFFNALQLNEAIEYGEMVALERKDTDSLPLGVNGVEIEVLIESAVSKNNIDKVRL
jgi:hypothetical protein